MINKINNFGMEARRMVRSGCAAILSVFYIFSSLGYGAEARGARVADLPPAAQALLDKARQTTPTRYQFAVDKGAKIDATPDGRSFYLTWLPPGMGMNNRTVIVSLHGSSSWAFDEF